jgi:DNA-binding transcriptional MerR regulator
VDALSTLPELVAEVAARIAALPAPKNGQVRAVPDERTVRYYGTLGLLDRPSAMRGRTALYGPKHAAQVVAIKRLQTMGRSLSEILALWPTLDDATLARMSGVALPAVGTPAARAEFWKREPGQGAAGASRRELEAGAAPDAALPGARATLGSPDAPPAPAGPAGAVELRIELAPQVVLSLSVVDDRIAVSSADVRAIRAAAAPLLAELASRRLAPHPGGDEP